MTWVKDTPRQPGYYWFQPTYSHPRVVEVQEWHAGRMYYSLPGSNAYMRIEPGVGRWSGVIPEPREG